MEGQIGSNAVLAQSVSLMANGLIGVAGRRHWFDGREFQCQHDHWQYLPRGIHPWHGDVRRCRRSGQQCIGDNFS